jgi:hypothetical protein
MERGYWDEEADREEARACTVLATTPNTHKDGSALKLKDVMLEWAYKHKQHHLADKKVLKQVEDKYETARQLRAEHGIQ